MTYDPDLWVYLGPFFECQTTVVSSQFYILACVNQSCSKYQVLQRPNTKFCCECGERISDRCAIAAEISAVDRQQVRLVLGDTLGIVGSPAVADWVTVHRWIPVESRHGLRSGLVDLGAGLIRAGLVVVPDPATEVGRFERLFVVERSILSDYYGVENVAVRWGMVVWVS